MKISIESIYFNDDIIKSIISYNLRIESFEISINNHFDLIISGKFLDLLRYLMEMGYIDEISDKEMMMGELDLYFID